MAGSMNPILIRVLVCIVAGVLYALDDSLEFGGMVERIEGLLLGWGLIPRPVDVSKAKAVVLPTLMLALAFVGGCWSEKPRVDWPTAIMQCAPAGDALLVTLERELKADSVSGSMRSAVVALAREHGPGAVTCALREVVAIARGKVAPKNAALRPNPYGSPVAANACALARELRLPIPACES